ncbi:MAG: 50S ribosomal protein L23 [Candidatus Bathyarchaeota archaeon]|nr:50S ribosomal protein L23 [Candidatus Bathyarchaeota archaeon]MCX8176807.1 50S ribosomal protein L23 [Candidatus Bathyarchaeota archaeon]MDW8193336.1 50S ribosomal protein L23 [Nitrososphaerota archaeon]
MNIQDVILYPLMTESASLMVEKENKLTFIVNINATKLDVKRAVEELFGVKVARVTIAITPLGEKKAYVKLHPEFKASDVAIKLGIL